MSEDMARTATVADEEILSAFDDVPSPIATAPDLSELVPLGQDAIRYRLKQMEEEGRVESYHVGSRATVWWRPD